LGLSKSRPFYCWQTQPLGFMFSGMTKSGAEKISPVHMLGSDWKYMSMAVAPPMDSLNRTAGRSRNDSLLACGRHARRRIRGWPATPTSTAFSISNPGDFPASLSSLYRLSLTSPGTRSMARFRSLLSGLGAGTDPEYLMGGPW
jgi:hypothetical protein